MNKPKNEMVAVVNWMFSGVMWVPGSYNLLAKEHPGTPSLLLYYFVALLYLSASLRLYLILSSLSLNATPPVSLRLSWPEYTYLRDISVMFKHLSSSMPATREALSLGKDQDVKHFELIFDQVLAATTVLS